MNVTHESVPARPAATDLLKSAATKRHVGRKPSGFLWDGDPIPAAETLIKSRTAKEAKSDYEMSRDRLCELVRPWYAKMVRSEGYQASVRMIIGAGEDGVMNECRMNFQHRYSKIPLDREGAMREVVGDDLFECFFKKQSGLKIRKEVAEDPETLARVVEAMMDGSVTKHFAEWFEYEEFLYPTKVFTERRFVDLDDQQNERLDQIGVRQVVSFGDATKDD